MQKRLNTLYPFAALLLGLMVAQMLATIQVYLSNHELYTRLLAIESAGYSTIPNHIVMSRLRELGPAFCGGLFFTFSTGAGISFFSLALAWIWARLFYRMRYLLYTFFLLGLGCLLVLNFRQFKPFVTLYFLVIPPIIFVFVAGCVSHFDKQTKRIYGMVHLIPVIILAILFSWQIDGRMFTDFRDIFLLSNPIGSKINSFYYKYTLFPAEVFKSLDQKMLKTCKVENIKKAAMTRSLEKILTTYDYIPITEDISVDLTITGTNDDLVFENHSKTILRISAKHFFTNPGPTLKEYAKRSDSYAFFRQITFLSLLIGLPLAVYVIMHGLISMAISPFLNLRVSAIFASLFCFVLCLILIIAFHLNRSPDVSIENLVEALNADSWQKRVAALKIIEEKGLEIKDFKTYPKLLVSSQIPERYWLVRTLANSRQSGTYQDLLTFLDDTHPNVVSMAFYALGQRGQKQAIKEIMRRIETSDDWYNQWYAYKALRSLGWKQKKSN